MAIDILWPLRPAGWVAELVGQGGAVGTIVGASLLAVPTGCALVGIGILIVGYPHRLNLLAVTLATTTLLLVLARLAFTFRENAQLYVLTCH